MTESEAVDWAIASVNHVFSEKSVKFTWRFYCMVLDAYLDRYLDD